jgi:hypothetical protein
MGAVMTVVPERSVQQRQAALLTANHIRSYRARMKKNIRAGMVQVPDLLVEVPWEIETMKVQALLLAMPKWGRVKVDRTLRRWAISPSKTVAGLSDRQREFLVAALGGRIRG